MSSAAFDQPPGAVPIRHVVVVGDGFAAQLLDFVDDIAGRTKVVHDDLRTVAREFQCMLATDPARGTGNDDNPSVM